MKKEQSNRIDKLSKSPLGDLGVRQTMFYGAPPILFDFAKKMRNNQTEAEAVLWLYLSNKQKGLRFKRQHPIKYFIADFYCHKAKLVIEVDGGYHILPEQYEYDKNRDYELNELGLKILRFTNEQVLFDIENVMRDIERELPPPTP
ncbi:MAG: endonuclease domain-containing protein [Lentimicrobiaceae bacterium]|jgi:cyclase|nr:endonuclease domain-containing protein [Lentimicrobiaceae bacterium]